MFAYNALNINYSSRQIIGSGIWESRNTNEIFRALNFYSNKKNIPYENFYFIDIGANVCGFHLL